jgi:hypothetical protein
MEEDLKKILEKNSQDVADIKKMVRGIKNHFIRREIYQWLVIILFVAPLFIGGFFIWPILKNAVSQYQELLGGASLENINPASLKITPELINQLKSLK